jgi:RimJ/RimL family protein N-acetyltransferase
MLARWLTSPGIASNLPSLDKDHLREEEVWTRLVKSEKYKFHIVEVDGAPVGLSVLYGFDRKNRSGCTGIVIFDREMQGKGIGYAAKHLQLNFAFEELALDQVHSFVMNDNARIKVGLSTLGYESAEKVSGGREKLTLTRNKWKSAKTSRE